MQYIAWHRLVPNEVLATKFLVAGKSSKFNKPFRLLPAATVVLTPQDFAASSSENLQNKLMALQPSN